jgi:hypothetical protein
MRADHDAKELTMAIYHSPHLTAAAATSGSTNYGARPRRSAPRKSLTLPIGRAKVSLGLREKRWPPAFTPFGLTGCWARPDTLR